MQLTNARKVLSFDIEICLYQTMDFKCLTLPMRNKELKIDASCNKFGKVLCNMCWHTFKACMFKITLFADKFEIARKNLSRAEDLSCLESSSEHETKQRRKRPPPQFTDESDSDHLLSKSNIGLPRPKVPPELKSVLGIVL